MWTLDAVRIFVVDESDSFAQTIARLQPLDSATVYHTFGYESDVKKLSAFIVGNPDRITLMDMTRDGATHVLSGVGWWWGDYYVKSVGTKLEKTINQTLLIDDDHDCDDLVFLCEIELYKDE